jgi:large subunit ribosomal protein L25
MLQLEAKKREIFGKRVNKLIKDGLIPAEIYGRGFENIHVTVPVKDFSRVLKEAGESTIITLVVDGKMFPVIIHEVKTDAIKDFIAHVDFYRVHMDEKIRAHVPVIFIGESQAVKEKGGVLIKSIEEIEVEALPADLPHELEVDLSSLVELHQSLHGSDIKVPKGVKIFIEPEMGIVTVIEPQKEEVVEAPVVAEGAEGAVPAEGEAAPTIEQKEEKSKK